MASGGKFIQKGQVGKNVRKGGKSIQRATGGVNSNKEQEGPEGKGASHTQWAGRGEVKWTSAAYKIGAWAAGYANYVCVFQEH